MAIAPRKIHTDDIKVPVGAASASVKSDVRASFGFTKIESGESPTLALEHNQQLLVLTESSPTLTIPEQSSVTFPIGFSVTILAVSGCTITGAGDVTINGAGSEMVSGLPALAELARVSTDTWVAHVGNAGTGLTASTLLATLQGVVAEGGSGQADMANAIMDVSVASASSKLLALINAVADIAAGSRGAALGLLHVGAEDDGPGNPGEVWVTDEFGNLTGRGFGGNELEEALDREPGKMPFDPELLGAYLAKGDNIASASTITVGEGLWFHVTGTTTITDIDFSFDGASGGRAVILLFDGACQVTHNASTLVVAGESNWTSAANDAAIALSNGSDKVYFYPIGGTGAGGGGFTAASTTEVLTGTNATKGVTPDALAAHWEKGSDVASAGAISLGEGGFFHLTGTTGVTDIDFATDKAGRIALIYVEDGVTFTHSSTLRCPGAVNLVTVAGDMVTFVSEASDVVRVCGYMPSGGFGDGITAASTTEALTGTDGTKFITANAMAALWEKGSDIASASTISIGEGGVFHVTGTTTITDIDFGTDKAGRSAILIFDGTCQVTHNASTLIIAGGSNYTSAAGDAALVISEGSDVVRFFPPVSVGGSGALDEWTAASASGPSTLQFFEDTDNGTNKITLSGQSSLSGDFTVTLPNKAGQLRVIAREPMWFDAASLTPQATSGAEPVTIEYADSGSAVIAVDLLAFSSSADEFAGCDLYVEDAGAGTFTFIPVMTHASTSTNFSVLWGFRAIARGAGEAFSGAAYGTAVTSQVEGGATGTVYKGATSSAHTPGGTMATGDVLHIQVYRDVDGAGTSTNDDLAADAYLKGFWMIPG